jgi:hypothetical protein
MAAVIGSEKQDGLSRMEITHPKPAPYGKTEQTSKGRCRVHWMRPAQGERHED